MEKRSSYIYGSAAPKLPERIEKTLEKQKVKVQVAPKAISPGQAIPRGKMIFCIIAMVAISFVILYRFSVIAELNYRMGVMTKQYNQLRDENRMLKVDIETSINLDKVKEIAETKLNMHKPEQYQVVLVSVPKNNYSVVVDQEYINENTRSNASLVDSFLNALKAALP